MSSIMLRRRHLMRVLWGVVVIVFARYTFFAPSTEKKPEIRKHGVFDLVARSDKPLDVQRYDFLQMRMGRDERPDLLSGVVKDGADDYWDRFEFPYITGKETSQMDQQSVRTAIEQLLSLNGWVAALCPTLTRPFGQSSNAYNDLINSNHLYFIGIVIHSADHFLVDQLAVIVQMARRLGTENIFVSMLDYDSSDSTETLTDLCEAVLTLLGVPFRIRRVAPMTEDPNAAYYPLEEAHMRNLALEPLHELYEKRKIKFHRVVWLKGFTCPNDILETIKVSEHNDAAMVCGMDWAENNGFYLFSDRWRTRDIQGDQFRQSKSTAKPEAGPPRDKLGAARYAQHLPFQVFCCESGTHVVDPTQSYYQGIQYRAGTAFVNLSTTDSAPRRDPDAPCLDSSQSWFCRDLWVNAAKDGMMEADQAGNGKNYLWGSGPGANEFEGGKLKLKRDIIIERPMPDPKPIVEQVAIPMEKRALGSEAELDRRQLPQADSDANVGSDYDAMPDSDVPLDDVDESIAVLSIPNSVFRPARILVNPRCVTTYAGVKHAQLALDLFGTEKEDLTPAVGGKYVLDDWEGAPESFVCQEMRQTGGRKATKTQRRLGFSIHAELGR